MTEDSLRRIVEAEHAHSLACVPGCREVEMKLEHTKGAYGVCLADYGNGDDHECALVDANTAPHECQDKECIGDLNRRKLEIFRILVKVIENEEPWLRAQPSIITEAIFSTLAMAKELTNETP